MKLDQLYAPQVFVSRKHDESGAPVSLALDTAQMRARALAPVDRMVKPGRFLYAGERDLAQGASAAVLREVGSNQPVLLTENAFSQLAQRVGPKAAERANFAGYLRACPPNLRMVNLNHWMQSNGNTELLLRTVQGGGETVGRAVLTEDYTQVDDLTILEALGRTTSLEGAEVRWLNLSEAVMMLRLTWKKHRAEAKPGDVVEYGVQISNSEVGRRAVRVEPVVYRLICSNGLIGGGVEKDGAWYIRHTGNKERIARSLDDAIRGALPVARELAARFSEAVKEVVNRPAERLRAIAKAEHLTEAQLKAAVAEMMMEAGGGYVTRYDLVNGLTGAGRLEQDPEARYNLERLGATYLNGALPEPLEVKD